MNTKWLIGFIMLFAVLSVIAGIMELTNPLTAGASRLQALLQPEFPEVTNPVGAVTGFVTFTWSYIGNLWGMFWFDYPFFQGAWAIVRFLIFIPVSIGMVVSLVLAAVRGVSSA